MEAITQQTHDKSDAVLDVIEKVLNQVFGKEATVLIYKHLELKYSLKRSEVVDNIELFARGLEDFLRSGANAIERKILEDMYSNCSLLRLIELGNVDDEGSFVSQMKLLTQKAQT